MAIIDHQCSINNTYYAANSLLVSMLSVEHAEHQNQNRKLVRCTRCVIKGALADDCMYMYTRAHYNYF